MAGPPQFGRRDALALLSLLATTVVVAWPILGGAYLTYIDNPVHLAEIYDLARPDSNGWSELAFAGLPVGTLHSPIIYPLLALLTRAGVPLGPMYAACLLAGVAAPSLALYYVARRRVSVLAALFLSYLVLVQPSTLWGIGSPLAGMWTHGLATGLLILLFDLLARPVLTARQHFAASVLLAVATLTHLFVLPLIAIIAGVTTLIHRQAGTLTRAEFTRRLVGCGIAALASAKYWLTMMWVSEVSAAPHPAFRFSDIVTRLVLPCEPLYLLDARIPEGIRYDLFLTDVLPSLVPVVLGVLAFVKFRRAEDKLSAAAFYVGVTILGCLVVHRYQPLNFLGPVSWRLIDWARLAFAIAAIDMLASPAVERLDARAFGVAALVAPLLGIWWGTPLRHDNPPSLRDDVAQVETLWTWLAANAKKEWGRLYVEDAFGWNWNAGGLNQSHFLVLTQKHVGLPQLGAYYGVVPYKLRWTLSEFNSLFSTRSPSKQWILEAMGKTNAGAIVTDDLDMAKLLTDTDAFELLHVSSHYSVFRLKNAEDRPIAELSPANHVLDVMARSGDLVVKVRTEFPRSRILAKVAYHPFWRLSGAPGAWLRESPEGFLVVDDIPRGEFTLHLWYEASHVPGFISAVGWLMEAAWALGLALDARRRREPVRVQAA
ncbi:MAG TPA: hypothetical protein VH062_00010 [Polyangiaceae bacterium]|jgi:hypothetical protein|nr:hypothetical protein [Polyangiaceae bacterium]